MIAVVLANKIGGMAQWNIAVVKHSSEKNKTNVNFILTSCVEDQSNFISHKEFNGLEVTYFYFSRYENSSKVWKRLSTLLKKFDLVICNDQLELHSLSLLNKRPHVIANIADWYNLTYVPIYYNLIDAYVTLSSQIEDVLNSSNYYKVAKYLPHGVYVESEINIQNNVDILNLIFLGRLVESKGCKKLIELENILKEKQINTYWKIIGSGPEEESVKEKWRDKENVEFLKPDNNEQVLEALKGGDFLVLPSEFEGYGIAILEAMACGLIPAVYNLPIGVTNYLDESNSIKADLMDYKTLAMKIADLYPEKDKLQMMKRNCHQTVLNHFDIEKTSNSYFDFYDTVLSREKKNWMPFKNPFKQSILDASYFPNKLSVLVRKLKKYAIG